MRCGTLALSWGRYGGFYITFAFMPRVCLGWVSLTFVPIELDDLLESHLTRLEALAEVPS